MANADRGDTGELNGGRVIDPSELDASAIPAEPAPRKRRGRPPGSGRTASSAATGGTAKKERAALDLSSLQGLLVGTSALLAIRMDEPAVKIEEDEAKAFLKAAQNVSRHYSVETTQKTLDWIAFVGVTGQVFGTRALTVIVNKAKKAQANPPKVTAPAAPSQANGAASYVVQPSVPPGPIEEFE